MVHTQTLKLTKTKEAVFAIVFIALSVYTPIIVHYFGGVGAGRVLLPMHLFVLVAGLLLGWRAGLAAGLLTPTVSYFVSGMPMMNILPFIMVELAVYGLVSGLLVKKFNVWISLIGALAAGRVFAFLAVFIFSHMNAFNYVLSAFKDGWRGIALQILFIPFIVIGSREYFRNIQYFILPLLKKWCKTSARNKDLIKSGSFR